MSTVYFLGAGASAADGLPLTGGLNYGVAAWLLARPKGAIQLRALYKDLYRIRYGDLARPTERWNSFLHERDQSFLQNACSLPNLIETLSLIDVSVSEGQSFGMSSLRRGRQRVEMDVQFLREARRQLTTAIAQSVKDATYKHRSPLTEKLIGMLEPDDAIVSTNWDLLPERCLVKAWKKRNGRRSLGKAPVRYHCIGERSVDWRGDDLEDVDSDARSLLRLHGALNWLGCACCATVYVNLEWSRVVDESKRRENYDECHCGAGLRNMITAPSFVKDYSGLGLRSVWREAQKRLEGADRWVFIGYSLPSDDFHVRAMLLRALCSKVSSTATKRQLPEIRVCLDKNGEEAGERYLDLFRIAKPKVDFNGFAHWIEQFSSTVSRS